MLTYNTILLKGIALNLEVLRNGGTLMLAKNFDDFVKVVEEAERVWLNSSPMGQELTDKMLKMYLKQNPNATESDWARCKAEFMTFLFVELLKAKDDLMAEAGLHLYHELRAEQGLTD